MTGSKNLSHWQRCALAFLMVLAIFLLPSAVAAQGTDEELEKEAQAIDKMIMCPVCPAETIDQAQVEISFQMRAIIREMLAEGRSREEVLGYFVDRYGPDILAAPPKSGANLVAWILPVAAVTAGLALLFLIVRSMTRRTGVANLASAGRGGSTTAVPGTESQDGSLAIAPLEPELAPYLDVVDRTLAARRGGRPEREGSSGDRSLQQGEGAALPAEHRDG